MMAAPSRRSAVARETFRWPLFIALAVVLVVLGATVAAAAAAAEETEAGKGLSPSDFKELMETLENSESRGFAPAIVPQELLDEKGTAALRSSLTAYYNYRTEGFDHRRRVFAWQLLSSKVIFVLVVFLVSVGVYFSWLQFHIGLRGGSGTGEASPDTTFEATATGIKVSSPVLGVIILVISLAFFYLYLVYVYKIEEIL